MLDKMLDELKAADYILVGIGMDFALEGDIDNKLEKSAYDMLSKWIGDKPYFVVTLKTNDFIYNSGFHKDRIVAPCGSDAAGSTVLDENYDESIYLPQWEQYKKWLQNTLNRKLCILELGVGFQYPSVIRWAFEKTAYYNQKSRLLRVHDKFFQLTPEIKERSISISENPINLMLRL